MSCLSDLVLDEKLAGEAISAAEEAHLAACASCAARLDTLQKDQAAFRARARPKAFADAVVARAKGRRRRWQFALAIAPMALGALAVVLVWLRPHGAGDGERVKGAPVAVELYVRSGDRIDRYSAERRYRGGDTLQLVYSASAPRHLAVVDVEAGGKAQVIYRSDGPLPAAKRRRLDQSWVLDDSASPERLYLVFTESPPDEAALLGAARRADVDRTTELDVPGAAQASFRISR